MPQTPIRDLSTANVSSTPRDIDWTETLGEDLDGWTAYGFDQCSKCGEWVFTNQGGEEQHRYSIQENEDEPTDCTGYVQGAEPMMNHFYPADFDMTPEDAARRIKDLPLCVITIDGGRYNEDETGFALTGGGMNLSWEIAEAYVKCGLLPPARFSRLPDYSRPLSNAQKRILAAMRRSLRIVRDRANTDPQLLNRQYRTPKKEKAAA